MKKIGILASHPIQYQAPLFRELTRHVEVKVFFACSARPEDQTKSGYQAQFKWDIDLLEGYDHRFLENKSPTPTVLRFWGCNTPEIGQIIAEGKFDIFIVMGWHIFSDWQAVLACKKQGVPILVRGDGQLMGNRSYFKKLLKFFSYPILFRQFDGFLSVGTRFQEYLTNYGVSKKRIFFSPHCVDNQRFRRESVMTNEAKRILRAQLGIDEGYKIVIFCGRLVDMKRPLDLIEALNLIKKRGGKLHALFVGSGALKEVIEKRISQYDLKVSFTGFVNQKTLPQYYGLADFLVLPSDASETWGLVVNEAMACGLPAIVSDHVGCAPDLVDRGKTGFTYKFGNTVELADSMELMMRSLSEASLRRAVDEKIEKYSIASSVGGILEAIYFFSQKINK